MGIKLSVIIALILLLSLLVTTYKYRHSILRIQNKVLASVSFTMIGIFALLENLSQWRVGGLILIALIASLIGDILLGLTDTQDVNMRNRHFVKGVIWFGIAHLFYIIGFTQGVTWQWNDLVIPALFLVLVGILSVSPGFDFKGAAFLVMVYAFVLGLMLKKVYDGAIGGVVGDYSRELILAATLFVLSDSLLIFKYFYYKTSISITLFNLICYYIAQILFAISILYL